jgi:hypothetical protein
MSTQLPTQTLQSFNYPLCPPEVEIIVTPEGSPYQVTTNQGTYEWPDLYQGTASSPNGGLPGYITPYVGNVASGVLTGGATFRTHAIGTLLSFSSKISSVPSGVTVTSQVWTFGDGFTTNGATATHTYSTLSTNVQAVLGVGFSNGMQVFTPKQMLLTPS